MLFPVEASRPDRSDVVRWSVTHPLDVTRSRDQYWPDVTGGHKPWFIPDWLAVSRDYDAVHLSVLAYLSTAGRALP